MMHNVRKDDIRRDEAIREDENLATAEIAGESTTRRPQLVNDRRTVVEKGRDVVQDVRGSHAGPEERVALFPDSEVQEMRSRWDTIQTGFVDEPRQAVERADGLVAHAIKRIADQFAHERSELEQQWDRGDIVSTEDLRQALRRYRSFFDRLLSV